MQTVQLTCMGYLYCLTILDPVWRNSFGVSWFWDYLYYRPWKTLC